MTLIFALVYLVLFPGLGNVKGLLGWTQEGQFNNEVKTANEAQAAIFARYNEMDNKDLIADPQAHATGQRLFANNCAICHGSDARGARGFPNLTDGDWLYGNAFDTVFQSITNGRGGVMPAMGAGMSDAEIEELVAYVQSLSGQEADKGLAARGEPRFAMMCAACHGADGSGNQALGAPRLNDDIWLYGGEPETIAQTLREGRNSKMPSHKNLLSADRRRLVAAYVLSLSGKSKP